MISGNRDSASPGVGVLEGYAAAGESPVSPKLEKYRAYLLMIANEVLRPDLRGKLGASDLVQETLLAAHENLPDFRGVAPADMRAWLRTILERRLSNIRRSYFVTKKRGGACVVPLEQVDPDGSTRRLDLPCRAPSPSNHAMGREWAATLEATLAGLPVRYRQAIELRNKQGLSFGEVGERMGCTEDAARKLWGRAILELKARFGIER